MFLVLNSGPTYAEWVLVSVVDQAGVTIYVDPATIHRKGDQVTMWELIDYRQYKLWRVPHFCRQGCNVYTIALETAIGLLR